VRFPPRRCPNWVHCLTGYLPGLLHLASMLSVTGINHRATALCHRRQDSIPFPCFVRCCQPRCVVGWPDVAQLE
jgi:hypothetical protein